MEYVHRTEKMSSKLEVRVKGGKEHLAEFISFAHLSFSKINHLQASSPSVLVFLCFFNIFNTKRLAWGNSLYQLLSDLLHRLWLYSNQEPTAYEADALSTRPSQET